MTLRASAAQRLLETWERGHRASPHERALLLLAFACPDEPRAALGDVPVAERDARLFDLRARLFGPDLRSVVACPACAEQLEFECPVAALSAGRGPDRRELEVEAELSGDRWSLNFRLPTMDDVAAVAAMSESEAGEAEAGEAESDEARAGERLLARCFAGASRSGEPVALECVPEQLLDAVFDRMAESDPGAEIELTCPSCDHRWQTSFDIVAYLWVEVDNWARRTLAQVARLASAYGWAEAAILGMSAWRRQAYLDLI